MTAKDALPNQPLVRKMTAKQGVLKKPDVVSESSASTEKDNSVDLEKLQRELNGENSPPAVSNVSSSKGTELDSSGTKVTQHQDESPAQGYINFKISPAKRDKTSNFAAESARQYRENMKKMEMEAEKHFESLKDSQTMIKNQAVKCLKTGKLFEAQRSRIESALQESKQQGKLLKDKLSDIDDKLNKIISEL